MMKGRHKFRNTQPWNSWSMLCVLWNKSDYQSFLKSLRKRKLKYWKGKRHFIAFGNLYPKPNQRSYFSFFLALNCSFAVCGMGRFFAVWGGKQNSGCWFINLHAVYASLAVVLNPFFIQKGKETKTLLNFFFSALDSLSSTFHEPSQSGLSVYVSIKVVSLGNSPVLHYFKLCLGQNW